MYADMQTVCRRMHCLHHLNYHYNWMGLSTFEEGTDYNMNTTVPNYYRPITIVGARINVFDRCLLNLH